MQQEKDRDSEEVLRVMQKRDSGIGLQDSGREKATSHQLQAVRQGSCAISPLPNQRITAAKQPVECVVKDKKKKKVWSSFDKLHDLC
jgi:hypothetical protein